MYELAYKKINHLLGPVVALVQQLNKAVAFYSQFYPEKVKTLQEYKGMLAIKHTKSSIPNTVGAITGLLDFDVVKDYGCKKVYRSLAQVLHPDKDGGDPQLFDFCHRAYKSGDINLLNAVKKYVESEKTKEDLQGLVHFVTVRATVLLEYFKSLPVYMLLQLDVHAGHNGEVKQAKDFMESLLDRAIEDAQRLLLKE